MSQSKIIIIRGNSGSGKTTVSKGLQHKLGKNTMLLSQDVIRREILYVDDGQGTKTIPFLKEFICYGYENCDYVILEGILKSNWYHALFLEIKEKFSSIYAYYYDLPFEETWKRHQTKPNRNEFGEEKMRSWWNEKDYMNIIPEKTLTKDLNFNETVELIYSDVIKWNK